MESLIINGGKIISINGVKYYYGEVTINNGEYIVVPDIHNYIIIYDGVYDPNEFDENINYNDFVLSETIISNPEWKKVITDIDERVLYGVKQDKSVYNPDLSGYTVNDGKGHTSPVSTVIDSLTKWLISNGRVYRSNSDNFRIMLGVKKEYVNPDDTPFTYSIDYDITSFIRVNQLEDVEGNPVTPYSSAKGVILDDGIDVESKLNYMDIDKISRKEVEVIATIGDSTENAIKDIDDEGYEYRADINSISGQVKSIDAKVFPLTINYTISPNFSIYTNTISVNIKEYDTGEPNINEEYIEKKINGVSIGKIYDPIDYQSTISISDEIQGRKEELTFFAKTVSGKIAQVSSLRYLCFYGPISSPRMTSDIALTLNKILSTTVSFNPTITTTFGQYIWLIVPDYLSINSVKSSGFDVTLNSPEYLNIGEFGRYKAYRTLNALDDAKWSLIIT